jgi:hypothetical protein
VPTSKVIEVVVLGVIDIVSVESAHYKTVKIKSALVVIWLFVLLIVPTTVTVNTPIVDGLVHKIYIFA